MAKIYPENLTYYNLTASEELFLAEITKQLNDEYHVFYSLKWSQGKEESESDFLIFHEDKGFICIEVKGGRSIGVKNNQYYVELDENERRYLRRSPHSQAEESMYYFLEEFKRMYNKKYDGIYGYAAAFPFYNFYPSTYDHNANRTTTINMTDLPNLRKKINDIFIYYDNKTKQERRISLDDNKLFLELVNKTISITQIKGGHNLLLKKQIEELTRSQSVIVDLLVNFGKVIINGPAGTGKTYISYKLLKRNQHKNILYVTLNEKLIKRLNNYLDIHKLTNNLITKIKFEDIKNIKEQFDLVIVDEAQELTKSDLSVLKTLSNSFYLFLDMNQQKEVNISLEEINKTLEINYPSFNLAKNVRSTSNIIEFLKSNFEFKDLYYTNNINGSIPESITLEKDLIIISYLTKLLIQLINKENIDKEKIVILHSFKEDNILLSKLIDKLVSLNIYYEELIYYFEDYKGLENDVVIFINDKKTDYEKYISYTRAKVMLFEVNIKNEGI